MHLSHCHPLGLLVATNRFRKRSSTSVRLSFGATSFAISPSMEEAVFRLPDIVERVGNATAGLLNRDAVATSIERVLLSPEVVRLTRPPAFG